MYLLWGTACGGWLEPFDWRAFVNFEFGLFSFPPSGVTPNCCTMMGQTVESWSGEWELISESILTTSLRSECAFANCTAGDASELFINRAKLLVNCVLSIMPACSHQYHRFIQSWHRRGNYCKFESRERGARRTPPSVKTKFESVGDRKASTGNFFTIVPNYQKHRCSHHQEPPFFILLTMHTFWKQLNCPLSSKYGHFRVLSHDRRSWYTFGIR